MSQERWTRVDGYLGECLRTSDPVLEAALEANRVAGLPAIDVSPLQGRFLQLLVRMASAARILEIGTLGGYSTIWLARGLPSGGRLVTLELDAKHAEVARRNVEKAGLAERVEIRVGRALDLLPRISTEQIGPFDLIFIDADKESSREYFDWALQLSRPGSVIVVDNVVRDGEVENGASLDPRVQGIRRMFEALAAQRRTSATALQVVGSKGWDGLLVAIVD